MEEKIVLTDDEGNEVEMYVVSEEGSEEASYEMVEDDSELDYIGRIFSELLEDIDIER